MCLHITDTRLQPTAHRLAGFNSNHLVPTLSDDLGELSRPGSEVQYAEPGPRVIKDPVDDPVRVTGPEPVVVLGVDMLTESGAMRFPNVLVGCHPLNLVPDRPRCQSMMTQFTVTSARFASRSYRATMPIAPPSLRSLSSTCVAMASTSI